MDLKNLTFKYFMFFLLINVFLVVFSGLFLINSFTKSYTSFYVNEKIKQLDYIIYKEVSFLKKLSVD
jgi:hypothetical protein